MQSTVQQELINLLKADDELRRLNEEAREQSLKDKDEAAEKQMQRQVARLLGIVGDALVEVGGSRAKTKERSKDGPVIKESSPRRKPEPITPVEPPTYIKLRGDKDGEITFFAGQRRYLRVETDANPTITILMILESHTSISPLPMTLRFSEQLHYVAGECALVSNARQR